MINERYAKTLTIVFVCFMYGTGMPILYWFALIFLVSKYLCDKFMVINVYRKPPMLDDSLHRRTLSIFSWVAVIFSLNSYWMLSNKQLFGNEVHPKNRMSDIEQTGHRVLEMPSGYSLVLLIIALAVLILVLLLQIAQALTTYLQQGRSNKREEDNKIGNYF